jgi:uncharacterized membrane protein
MKQPPIKSTHVDNTVQAIARLRADHDQKATPLERTVDRLTGRAASPRFVVLLSLVLVSWIGLNTILLSIGRRPLDEPPFFWMQGAVSLAALYMTVLILATQRRENELASHHEHLTLELAILSEQKTAKSSLCWRSFAKIIRISTIGLTTRRPRCRSLRTRNRCSKRSKGRCRRPS